MSLQKQNLLGGGKHEDEYAKGYKTLHAINKKSNLLVLTQFSLNVYVSGGSAISDWFQWFSLMLEERETLGLPLTAQCLVVKCTPPAALFVRERRVL